MSGTPEVGQVAANVSDVRVNGAPALGPTHNPAPLPPAAEYVLSEKERAVCLGLQATIGALQQQLEGACKLMLGQQGAEGTWALSADCAKLTRGAPGPGLQSA